MAALLDSSEEIAGRISPSRTISIEKPLGITLFEHLEIELHRLNETEGDILCKINCKGGNLFVGMQTYELLRKSENPVIGYVEGRAESAAFMALQGCSLRIATEEAVLSIHNPAFTDVHNSIDHRTSEDDYVETARIIYRTNYPALVSTREVILKMLLARSRFRDMEELETFLEIDRIMNPTEALSRGFIDEIVHQRGA